MNYTNSFIKPRCAAQAEVNVVEEAGLPVITEGLPGGSSKGKIIAKPNHRQDYAEYLEGDSWKCSKSPSRAHHWIVRGQTICKYCLTAKLSQAALLTGDIAASTITK
jgi:hypothetical protein